MSRPHIFDYRTDFWVSVSGRSQLAALICGALLLFFYNCAAAADQSTAEQPVPMAKPGEVPFEYSMENRPDPFVPFITEKAAAAKVDMNEIIETSEPLTGMQLFEPGQLTLVALLKKGKDDFAMVEDFTGKGYVLNEGMKIGKRGVVKDIRTNEVLIEETAVTRAGKKITTEIVMVLKNEKEE